MPVLHFSSYKIQKQLSPYLQLPDIPPTTIIARFNDTGLNQVNNIEGRFIFNIF